MYSLDRDELQDAVYELETFGRTDSNVSSSLPLSSIKPAWKRSLHELLEYPSASSASFVVHILTNSLIIFSALITICETIPAFRALDSRIFFGIESSLVALFTVEYVARALAWSMGWGVFWRWALSFFGIVDLLAILPYYIELFLGVDTSVMFRFSILRTFRLLRVFRAFRTNNTITLTIEVMYLSVRHSQHALLALGFFLVMFLVIFSTILYFIERGTWDPILQTFIDVDGEPSQFSCRSSIKPTATLFLDLRHRISSFNKSIPAAGWFVLVTITTVGYGDLTPRSFLGRLLTVPLLVFGLLLIALPSFVLGREFSKLWDAHALDDARILAQDPERRRLELDEPPPAALARQIVDLQGALDAQGQMLRRLLATTEGVATLRSPASKISVGSDSVLFDYADGDGGDASSELEKEVDLGKEGGLASRNSRRKAVTYAYKANKGKQRASGPVAADGTERMSEIQAPRS